MEAKLVDGKGSGLYAEIDNQNRLIVGARSSLEQAAIKKAGAFFIGFYGSAQVTQTGGHLFYLRNDGDTPFALDRWVYIANGITTCYLGIITSLDTATLANHTSTLPYNTVVGNSKIPDMTCYRWNATGDGIVGVSSVEYPVGFCTPSGGGNYLTNLEGAIILKKNAAVSVYNRSLDTGSVLMTFSFMGHLIEDTEVDN